MLQLPNKLNSEAVRVKVNTFALATNEKVRLSRQMQADFSMSSTLRLYSCRPISSARGWPHTKAAYLTLTLRQHLSEIPHRLYNKPQQHMVREDTFSSARI